MATRKLTGDHRRFILQQVAAFERSPSLITRRLASAKWGEDFNFTPVQMSTSRVHAVMQRLDPELIKAARLDYLDNFDRIPLAFKKERILYLVDLLKKTKKLKTNDMFGNKIDASDVTKIDRQMALIRQIKDEVGEDADKLADAIARSGQQVFVSAFIQDFQQKPREDQDAIRKETAAFYARNFGTTTSRL